MSRPSAYEGSDEASTASYEKNEILIRIRLASTDPLSGRAEMEEEPSASPAEFQGWLGFLRVISQIVARNRGLEGKP